MTPALSVLESAAARSDAELEAYLRGPFIADFIRAVTLNALADQAERLTSTLNSKPERA